MKSLQSKAGRVRYLNPKQIIKDHPTRRKACLELVSATGAIFCNGMIISIGGWSNATSKWNGLPARLD